MHQRKFEVDELTVDFYIVQIKQLCEYLREDYWHHYQSIHKVVWENVVNVWRYRKGADIDIMNHLLYTLCRVQSVYIEAIKSGECYSIDDGCIIEIVDDI